ncbi:MMPL family transporter [Corynebacterium poyangense]|uniref:MMPL family transporter n=1 Tax=Corynebacterium poyangense TaxID=2684405 RepID=UPI0021CDDA91|nr:MMPL family transporter [Corynebacterium poyangense]
MIGLHTRRHFFVSALIILFLGLSALFIGPAEQSGDPSGNLPDGADSTQVADLLAQQPEGSEKTAIALFYTDDGSALDLRRLAPIAQQFGAPLIPADNMKGGIAPISLSGEDTDNPTALGERIKSLRNDLNSDLPPHTVVQVTGPAAIQGDLASVFDNANFLLLSVTAAIVAILLIITYRSPLLWIIPLTVIGVADRVAASVFTWVLHGSEMYWSEQTTGILSVLVFGAGTNYALLLISRYRDELHRHDSRVAAMAQAWAPSAKTCVISALTVVLGMGCLMLSSIPINRGLGAAAIVGIFVAWVFALLVLPGALLLFGRWIFWPQQPVVGDTINHSLWRRISRIPAQRPVTVLVASFLVLGITALGWFSMKTGLSQEDQFINTPESITAAQKLEEYFPDQDANPATVVTQQPQQVMSRLSDSGFGVQPAPAAGSWETYRVSGASTSQLRETLAGTDALVGGQEAQLLDTENFEQHDRLVIFPAVLGIVFLALAVALRSFLAPLIMTATVLLTNISALGLGWWISTKILGFSAFAPSVPLYSFVFLVALGIDYSIFLISRAKEEPELKTGIFRALEATGGVITSAGILLASVFAALGVLPLVALAQVGIVIFLGVLLDTLLVRTLFIPAIVRLLGEKFWWPRKTTHKQARSSA